MKTVRDLKGRPLTPDEVERLAALPFSSAPPWTPERVAGNEEFRRVIADLYLDGVSMTTIAEATSLSMGAVNQQILKARRAGLLSRPRRVVTRTVVKPAKPSKHRPLRQGEADILRYYYGNVKMLGDRRSRWEGPMAEAMVDYMRWLRLDGVTLGSIGGAMGVSRERVRQILRDVEVTPLPDI